MSCSSFDASKETSSGLVSFWPVSSSSPRSVCVYQAERKKERSLPPGCVIARFAVSHVDCNAENRLCFSRKRKREGEMSGETYMEGGGRAARERESDGGEETWKSIFIVGELSRQQWM